MFRKLCVVGLAIAGVVGAAPALAGADTLVGVGANATNQVTEVIANQYNVQAASVNGGDLVVNVPAQVVPPEKPGVFIPGDSVFNSDFTYNVGTANTAAHLPPNGAGAGRTALINDATGFIDFARSSSARAGTDPASEEFYAFALDAVTWVKFAGNPVTSLTQQDLIRIYTCNPVTGAPFVSNWANISHPVAGFSGPIAKYQAQLSSGRQKTFEQKVLNGATVDQNCDASHLSPRLEESNASGTAAATRARAIYFYGFSAFTVQSKSIAPNTTKGATLGAIGGVLPSATTINTGATRFVGTQYLWNVAKTTSPSYARVINFIGETPTGNGYICAGRVGAILKRWGYVPLPNAIDPKTGHASRCLKEPTPL